MTTRLLWCAAVALISGCAAPPLTLYTLGTSPIPSDTVPPAGNLVVIAVARVSLPDELDTQDIFVRDGSTLRRSSKGRWATRLSLSITDRLTERLAERRPHAVLTGRPLTDTPDYRILINIGQLDVDGAGAGTLDADWLIVPRAATVPTTRDKGHFVTNGPVATDQDVVMLVGALIDRLAEALPLPAPR